MRERDSSLSRALSRADYAPPARNRKCAGTEKRMARRQRNNIARLPAEIRFRISELLDDGATYGECREDPEVAAACEEAGVELHDRSFLAFRESDEHRRNRDDLHTWRERAGRRRWAARIIEQEQGASSLADVAQLAILEQLEELASGGIELTGRDICKVANSIATMQRVELAKSEAERKSQLLELRALIDDLQAENRRLRDAVEKAGVNIESGRETVDLAKVSAKMDELLGG